jgi:polyhydroxybutyrate depolymerase
MTGGATTQSTPGRACCVVSVLAAAWTGCTGEDAGRMGDLEPGQYWRSLRVSNLDRQYRLVVPRVDEPARPAPLVLDFHGFTSSVDEQERVSGFRALAEQAGFVLVFPEGYAGAEGGQSDSLPPGRSAASWNAGPLCCGPASREDIDDVELVREIVRAVSQEVSIDPLRIYATGISNGGALVHRLGCEATDLIAAIAPLAFPIALVPEESCRPSRPIPVIYFAGRTDTVVPFDGGEWAGLRLPSAQETFRYWRDANDCVVEPLVEAHVEGASRCQTATQCAEGARVTFCSLEASQQSVARGHVLYLNPDISISRVAWEFLSQFRLPDRHD